MARVLLLFATQEGQTRRIAERVAARIASTGHAVELCEAVDGAPLPALVAFDAVMVGASVHYGHHPAHLRSALRSAASVLEGKRGAFFSVSLSADGPGAKPEAAKRYMTTFLKESRWQPAHTALFGGALKYSQYGRFKRQLVRLFVRCAGGDTDTSRDYEYTDWGAVERFADAFAALLAPARGATAGTGTSSRPVALSAAAPSL